MWGATASGAFQSGRLSGRGAVTVLREPFGQIEFVGFDTIFQETDAVVALDATAALMLATQRGDGPAIGAFRPLADLRLGAVFRVASGDPYQPLAAEPAPFYQTPILLGSPLSAPARLRLDLRLGRTLRLGPSALEAFVWVENVLGRTNALRVYPGTGRPDDDGYLASNPSGPYALDTETERQAFQALYSARVRDPFNVGRPRQIRFGLRLDL